jgi:hypothetical protein
MKCTCYSCHKRRDRKRKASCILWTLKVSCLLELLWSVLMLDMKVLCHFCWIELMLVDMNVMRILDLL